MAARESLDWVTACITNTQVCPPAKASYPPRARPSQHGESRKIASRKGFVCRIHSTSCTGACQARVKMGRTVLNLKDPSLGHKLSSKALSRVSKALDLSSNETKEEEGGRRGRKKRGNDITSSSRGRTEKQR